MACSAGGPMGVNILDVGEDGTKCNEYGKKVKRPRETRCPEGGPGNLSPI